MGPASLPRLSSALSSDFSVLSQLSPVVYCHIKVLDMADVLLELLFVSEFNFIYMLLLF